MLDPALILCENCGYDVGSLEARLAQEPGLKCPECAKPIAESLPERRTGTPWQRAPGVRSLLATNLLALRRPLRIWRVVSIDFPSSRNLLEWNLAITAVAWGVALAFGVRDHHYPGRGGAAAVIAFVALNLLVLIEWGGVQLFARPRRWRTTGHVAWAIVAHASVGWLLGPMLAICAATVAMQFDYRGWGASVAPRHGYRSYLLLMLVVGIPAGLLAFESLVYLGFRAMRFANAPR